jgi:hypothetical protein
MLADYIPIVKRKVAALLPLPAKRGEGWHEGLMPGAEPALARFTATTAAPWPTTARSQTCHLRTFKGRHSPFRSRPRAADYGTPAKRRHRVSLRPLNPRGYIRNWRLTGRYRPSLICSTLGLITVRARNLRRYAVGVSPARRLNTRRKEAGSS